MINKKKIEGCKKLNKYDLTTSIIRKMKVIDRSQLKEPLFWRNNVTNSWCISENVGTEYDIKYRTENWYWIGIYDDKDEISLNLTSWGGMCGYDFEEFFREESIEYDVDLQLQCELLKIINNLLDSGIIGLS